MQNIYECYPQKMKQMYYSDNGFFVQTHCLREKICWYVEFQKNSECK